MAYMTGNDFLLDFLEPCSHLSLCIYVVLPKYYSSVLAMLQEC